MATATPKLEWCTVRFENESLWWVQSVNKGIHWGFDELGIIDPRQLQHVLELLGSMREYGLQDDIVEKAFFKFRLKKEMTNKRFRLERTRDSIYDPDQVLFILPDDIDEESGPFEDFMKHILRVRVRMLNDLIESDQPLTVEEVDAEIREAQATDTLEEQSIHYFTEITTVLEYTPDGLDADELKDIVEGEVATTATETGLEDGYEEINEDDEAFKQDKEALNWEQQEEEQQRKRDNPELDDVMGDSVEVEEKPKPRRGRPPKKK